MITLNLGDPRIVEHYMIAQKLRRTGLFTDEELQEAYNRQLEKDAVENSREKEVV